MNDKYADWINSMVNYSSLSGKFLVILVVVITAMIINYSYSMSMMFLTTFVLAYLTKGSRRK